MHCVTLFFNLHVLKFSFFSEETHKVVNKYADYFVLEEKLRVNDLKRAQKSKFANDVEGIQGSFKKLDLD